MPTPGPHGERPYVHYGWPASPYSAKSRAALRVSGLPWTEVQPNALTFSWLQAQIGRKVIPVMRVPSGAFVQDSSRIVDAIEADSGRPMTPLEPYPRALALAFEVFADEWLIYPAMYFRWRYRGGDFDYMVHDFGRCAAPGLPVTLQRRIGRELAEAMHRYLPIMGIDDQTGPAIEHETGRFLADLAAHLEQQPYLLGARPCIADFSVYGPLAAHIGRDPWSAEVIDAHPAVRDWIERIDAGLHHPEGPYAAGASLEPLLRAALRIAGPAWATTHRLAQARHAEHRGDLHRRLGEFTSELEGPSGPCGHEHKLTAVTAWKLQRLLRALASLDDADKARFAALGGERLLELTPIDGLTLEQIAFRRDPTTFGPVGQWVDRATPTLRRISATGPLWPKGIGPVVGLG